MFEDYLQDSDEFVRKGIQLSNNSEIREARRYYRAAVFYAAGAMEAFVNYIADSFEKADSLTQFETAYLNDKALAVNDGKVIEKQEFHRLEDKIKLLLKKFSVVFDLGCSSWNDFLKIKKLRDDLIHPRKSEDTMDVQDYQLTISRGLTGIIDIMNYMSIGIFQKPLRRQLLDLIPE
jgi:hypothetical protein